MLHKISADVNETGSRLAVLEERATNLRKKTQLTEQELLEYERGTRAELKAMTERLTELAHKVGEVKEKIDAMAGELGGVARRHEVQVLERYLDLWQPLTFVTREEAKLLVRAAVEEARQASKGPATSPASRVQSQPKKGA